MSPVPCICWRCSIRMAMVWKKAKRSADVGWAALQCLITSPQRIGSKNTCPRRPSGLSSLLTPMNRQALLMATAIALAPFSPTSAQEAYRPPIAHERKVTTVVVHTNGTHEMVIEDMVRIETELGVNDHGERIMSFNSALEELEVLEAATITPQCERIQVESNAIRTVEEELSGGAPMFSDMKNKVIVYPRVQVGSRLYLKVRSHQHTPHFGNQFFLHDVFSPHELHDHVEYHVMVHPGLPLKISAQGMQGGAFTPEAEQAAKGPKGYRHYRFTYSQPHAYPREPGQLHFSYFAPHIMLTTFSDYVAVGKSYEAYAAPKVRVTPMVRALADQITKGISGERETIRALYEWVARNIRYVAIYLGDGGFEPHDVETILNNRYGDCKDHVVLLQSLLSAKGIDSSPALINLGAGEDLSPVAVTFPLNHVILYVPGLDLYLDPTAQFAPFGVLPEVILNKPVVLTRLNRLGRTPKMRAEENRTASRIRIDVLPDGRLRGASETTFSGSPEFEARGRHLDREGRSPERTVRSLLARFNEIGFGVIKDTDPVDLSKPFELNSRFELDAPVNIPGPSAMMVPVGLSAGRVASIAFTKPLAQRRFPSGCSSELIEEDIEMRFPASIRVTRIPAGTRIDSSTAWYTSSFALAPTADGQLLRIKRSFRMQHESGTCGPEHANTWKDFHAALYRDVRAQIFIE
ncbi:MAG: DUF3857 domain-containing protein [Burkholderiaceae bacterium]|nr:DUF3857 domain-containing protein [Burkholderiaceae bacterium]